MRAVRLRRCARRDAVRAGTFPEESELTELAVVLLNWNRAEATLRCLRALAGWRRVAPEVWVVDNASQGDDVARIRRDFPATRLLASAVNLGFGGGNNLALECVESSFVLLLNTDAIISEEDVGLLWTTMAADPRVAVAGPLLVSRLGAETVVAAGGRDIARHPGTHVRRGPRELERTSAAPWAVDYVPGTVALIRRAVLDETGLFDPDYFFSGEMADLCERIRSRGHLCVVVPGARATHDLESESGLRESLYSYYSLRNRFLFVRKFRRRWLVPLFGFWLSYGGFAVARALIRGRRLQARALALAVIDGVRGRFGAGNERVAPGR